ncbi:MAG: hypothetical protein R6X33_03745 [Candidatus Brocadiia bacterium]
MDTIVASKLLIVEGADEEPRAAARIARLRECIEAGEALCVDDAELEQIVANELPPPLVSRRHGMHADFEPVVILNRFRFDDPEPERERRREAFPNLDRLKLLGYTGFDGQDRLPDWAAQTGYVCQPHYALHTVRGCPFRCAYCQLAHYINVMVNVEDLVDRLDGYLDSKTAQRLFQWDNWTDPVCFEPEYGAAELLVEYFADRPNRFLEVYVGKSDNVDFLLDLDHGGQTVCCWSLSGPTQSRFFEHRTAAMEDRIGAMRRCEEAGYTVRVRFSPIIPVKGWREENRRMVRRLCEAVSPDLFTLESHRFQDYAAIVESFDTDLLDEEFLDVMRASRGREVSPFYVVPDDYRAGIYEVLFDELDRVAPDIPRAFCRENRSMWERFADYLGQYGQSPTRFVCNCGPRSVPAEASGHRRRRDV